MKKNEHYFPTMQFLKDDKEACGWRRTVFESGASSGTGRKEEASLDVGAGGMDEGAGHEVEGGDVERAVSTHGLVNHAQRD